MSIKSLVSFVFTCAAAAVFVLFTAGSGQALELCVKADRTDPTEPRVGSKIKLRSVCKEGKEVSVGTTDDLAAIATLQAAALPCASQVGDDVIFEGCNVHVRSGAGSTCGDPDCEYAIPSEFEQTGSVNGLGNLIVGYNENGADFDPESGIPGSGTYPNDKTGSHNLVVGPFHSYSSYGGVVAGWGNNVSGQFSSVSGGIFNTASRDASSVSGGGGNTASGFASSVSGGGRDNEVPGNIASGSFSWAAGGTDGDASGDNSSVSGGQLNTASGWLASVSGGRRNIASGNWSSVSGGYDNTTSGAYSSVSGGNSNVAGRICLTGLVGNACTSDSECDTSVPAGDGLCASSSVGLYSSVSGGEDNTASGDYSSVSGGNINTASGDWSSVSGGGGNSGNTASGDYSSVSGGSVNIADGDFSSVSGGSQNTAGGSYSSVSGGQFNNAASCDSSISGGEHNIANGCGSSVSGGANRTAAGIYDWAAGSLLEDD